MRSGGVTLPNLKLYLAPFHKNAVLGVLLIGVEEVFVVDENLAGLTVFVQKLVDVPVGFSLRREPFAHTYINRPH
jgi:hypothetical protein